MSCFIANNDKNSNTLSCECHDDDALTFNYDKRDLIKEFLQHADIINVVPTTSDFVPICFMVNNLQEECMKFIYILAADPADNIFFFLNKEGQYTVSQLEISPDESRIGVLLAKKTATAQFDIQYIIRVYERRPQAYSKDFEGNMFDMGHEIPGFYPWNNAPKLLFDCRYFSSRIVVANVKRIQNKELTNYIAAYTFSKRSLLFAQKEGIFVGADDCDMKNALMSPDGIYVIAVINSKSGNKEIGLKPGKSLVFFDPDRLVALNIFHVGVDNVLCCFVADIPAFSKSGRKIAVRHKKNVKIIQLPFPPTLQSLCRSVFIEYMLGDIRQLSIPQKIKDYLQYRPYLE